MTIDEAIRILEERVEDLRGSGLGYFVEAVSLGIEALKRFKEAAAWDGEGLGRPLPGETEE